MKINYWFCVRDHHDNYNSSMIVALCLIFDDLTKLQGSHYIKEQNIKTIGFDGPATIGQLGMTCASCMKVMGSIPRWGTFFVFDGQIHVEVLHVIVNR